MWGKKLLEYICANSYFTVKRFDGGTENARLEKAGRLKMQGWKTRDWKTRHQTAGVENARLENAGPKLQGWKTREKACMDSQMLLYTLIVVQISHT